MVYTERKNGKKKTTVWTFQTINKRNLTREILGILRKGKFKRKNEFLLIDED